MSEGNYQSASEAQDQSILLSVKAEKPGGDEDLVD
mgnify:CR=1 FL=1